MRSIPANIWQNYDLVSHNTLAVPAVADWYATPATLAQLRMHLRFATERDLPVTILGAGSNVVLPERIEGLVLRPLFVGVRLVKRDSRHVLIEVGASEDWAHLVRFSLRQGWYGLENLALIPGSVGAAPVQNIGAYGVELARFVLKVVAVDVRSGIREEFSADECDFSYRQSVFRSRWRDHKIITSVHLCLDAQARPYTEYESLREHLKQRGVTQPSALQVYRSVATLRRRLPNVVREPNVGSFFVNPELDTTAYRALLKLCPNVKAWQRPDARMRVGAADLLERCGWKGRTYDGVQVHSRHALVIVNHKRCSGVAVMRCAQAMRLSVEQKFGVSLEIEPRVLVSY